MGELPLKRPETVFDTARLRAFFAGRRVLVTGAAGSVGGAVARRLAALGCRQIALLDQFDHGLIEIVEQIEREHPGLTLTEQLCDIRDSIRLHARMREFRPDVVIHSAALKHVHLGERHPAECVLTNLVGVRNAAAAAAAGGASDFVLVSSDKAAAPVCVMGATKRLAELFLAGAANRLGLRLKTARFGNVWGSQGSVLPRFKAQIESGGPLLVTHPDMNRFFMSSGEAVGLILSVAALQDADANGAFFMEMGQPQSILEIGREMIRQSGRDIEIKFTGLRPGEKIGEQLFDENEIVAPFAEPRLMKLSPLHTTTLVTDADIDALERAARTVDDATMRRRVFELLDERLALEGKVAG
jgi:O-antigen biosynthesis protein WbqV